MGVTRHPDPLRNPAITSKTGVPRLNPRVSGGTESLVLGTGVSGPVRGNIDVDQNFDSNYS